MGVIYDAAVILSGPVAFITSMGNPYIALHHKALSIAQRMLTGN